MPDVFAVEETCKGQAITLVIHPAIRMALSRFETVFTNRAAAFLRGEGPGAYYLPLPTGGDVKLVFSLRYSPGEHLILRVDTARPEGLTRIKRAMRRIEDNRRLAQEGDNK